MLVSWSFMIKVASLMNLKGYINGIKNDFQKIGLIWGMQIENLHE